MTMSYLRHHGIKGMRWGIRRGRNVSSDHADTVGRLSSKHVSELSNTELADLTKRMQLERSFKDLKSKEVSAGRQFINKVVVGSLSTVATLAATSAIKYAIKKVANVDLNKG